MVLFEGSEITLGDKVAEGKTKEIYDLKSHPGFVLLKSKDKITAHNATKSDDMEGKAKLSTDTTCKVFELLEDIGIKSHYAAKTDETSFMATKCSMIPIEWVTRRVATGSFLKRNKGVPEGYRFSPPKMETFFKDDEAGDPQWSKEQILASKIYAGDWLIGEREYEMMARATVVIFEILEKAWASIDSSLIDMKIEFGVNQTGDILLADVIDNDSWRLWLYGDKKMMKDKQVYRDLDKVTPEAMNIVRCNYLWVSEQLPKLMTKPRGRVAVFMGSPSDIGHCKKIQEECNSLGLECDLRVTSAHKTTENTLSILAQYEAEAFPTVFIAVAGRSNGLGPVLSGNASWPVINCPPIKADWGSEDIWSSLRLPSGLGCSTVLLPEAAALQAAQILSLNDHIVWGRLRALKLTNLNKLMSADMDANKSMD